jgi:SAM-dependent methyltransferase
LTTPYARSFTWSPYYKIEVAPLAKLHDGGRQGSTTFARPLGHTLTVNNDYHQMLLDLRPREHEHPFQAAWRRLYDAPYADAAGLPPGPILVVGAGTGNDVAAALRRTDREVHAVEIDPVIVGLGRRLHAERPYDDPRVRLTVDDARSFFQRATTRYALVVFGFLDSHTLVSSRSSVRLDNFVYTRESLEQVRRILLPGGKVALTFAATKPWMRVRIAHMLQEVFRRPTWVTYERRVPGQPRYTNGVLFESFRPPLPAVARARPRLGFRDSDLPVPEDDWPFLYLKYSRLPLNYRGFLALVLVLGFVPLLFLPRGGRRLRLPFFFLGAAFFLIETSNVISLSLLYGSTWTVNVLVFCGILSLILLGNLTCHKLPRPPLKLWFALLVASISAAYFTPTSALLGVESALLRGLCAVVVFLGPVYFASIIFARLIREERDLYQAYGSNVLGAVVGGACEYLSLMMGFKFLLGVTLAFYLVVFLLTMRGDRAASPVDLDSC